MTGGSCSGARHETSPARSSSSRTAADFSSRASEAAPRGAPRRRRRGVVHPDRRREERRARPASGRVPLRSHRRRGSDDGRRPLWVDYDGDGGSTSTSSTRMRTATSGGMPPPADCRGATSSTTCTAGSSTSPDDRHGAHGARSGCVAADLDGNGATDLVVTTDGYDANRDAFDAILWNNGDGTFTEGAKAAGIDEAGWHSGAAVADVNGDGRLTSSSPATPTSTSRCPVRVRLPRQPPRGADLLYLNVGQRTDTALPRGRSRRRARATRPRPWARRGVHRRQRRRAPGLYVANDLDPNRLYLNLPAKDGLGFRLVEQGKGLAVDDPNAGMGIAAGDYSGTDATTCSRPTPAASSTPSTAAARASRSRTPARTSSARSAGRSPAGE